MSMGTLLRSRRKEQNLTLRTVAERAGISEGFMSQVENDVKSPSVSTLLNICEAIDMDIGYLFTQVKNQERLFVIRRAEWDEVDLPHTGFATRRFCPPEKRTVLDSGILIIEPGKSIPGHKKYKNGQEILCILQGSLELTHGDKLIRLEAGDGAFFWTEPERQSVTNPGGELAVVLWVGTM